MLKLYYQVLLGTALSFAATVGCVAANSREKEHDTTVCELYSHLTSPLPGRVHLKAIVYRGPRHGAVLTDPQCPGKAIGLRLSDSVSPETSVAKFNTALTGDVMDLSLRVFDVEASGILKASGPSRPEAFLLIDHVERFKKHEAASSSP
ncbi:hypothetical protein [Dyella sp. GSA-30]|uniref:hypothetical protein n=1 Tax=Dyella sp. GSA-30 TaxID=2994496 RepID=UPI002491F07E|nr:hypothetical protein [Dyella sp. GSA-30]BDU20130.1 hypothetical protein DYGSA30_15870 [Dyella sp. GSA-30]